MKYEGRIIRPPSEADSLLIQVTVGCSHNRCTFCGSFKDKAFRIKTQEEIEEDIQEASRFGRRDRVFLCDGDALIIPQVRLVKIIESIRRHIPGVTRIGLYGNAKSILRKTREDLEALRDLGLGMVYLGVETGNEELLRKIVKGADAARMVEAARRVKDAGIKLSVTVLLGIGGVEGGRRHALDTAKILTEMNPDYIGALTVMLVPETPLYRDYREGAFVLPDAFGFIEELGILIANVHLTDCFFTSNHASNYLPLRVRLPEEREKALHLIGRILKKGDRGVLRPEYFRGL
jgi:radical SAM superfamily enzyme YgiQ (UPF0313 family)